MDTLSEFELAVNFHYVEELKTFLPQLLVLKRDKGQNYYFHKTASDEVLDDFPQFNTLYPEHIKLINCLQINALTKRFLKKNRPNKIKDIFDLLNTSDNEKIISAYIAQQKNKILELLQKSPLKISFQVDKQSLFKTYQIRLATELVSPLPYFEKTTKGILYSLQLKVKDQIIYPSDYHIITLLDDPGWVLIDHTIYRLEHLNANKLTPFLNKKIVDIPEKIVKTYFEKFIKDVVKKVDISAKGFDIHTQTALTAVILLPFYHFFEKRYVIQIQFQYHDITFNVHESRQKHISLNVDENDKVIIYETKRNKHKESTYIERLALFNLTNLDPGIYTFSSLINSQTQYHDIEELLAHKELLVEAGFSIPNFTVDNYQIAAQRSIIQTHINQTPDWFDVNIQVSIGSYSFPFVQLASHIRQENPFYQLPDGTYFIIPNEWFSKFKTFLNFTSIDRKKFQLPLKRFPLLQIFDDNHPAVQPLSEANDSLQVPSTLLAQLRPYQMDGFRWLWQHHQNNTGACLADDMGLGKTLQCITILEHVKQSATEITSQFPTDLFTPVLTKKPPLQTLIICPTSLVFNWSDEINKFVPHWKIINYTGKNRTIFKNEFNQTDVVITSYQTFLRDLEFFTKQTFNYIIADESQFLKNRDSKIFKAISSIQTLHRVALSGTPIENSLSDLWSLMQFINPEILGAYATFEKHFKIPIEKRHDETVLQDLKNLIMPFILRRTKNQVLKDLPELTEQIIKVAMTVQQHRLYVTEKSKARNMLLKIKGEKNQNIGMVFKTLMRLRQISNHPILIGNNAASGKFDDVSAYLLTLNTSGVKTLIFSFFSQHLQLYTDWCNAVNLPYAHFDGSSSVKIRQAEINRFKTDSRVNLFFITTGSGGVGLNLTEATTVLLLDPWWNPFKELQAISRSHRIGQKAPVHVVRFISKESIEEKILNLQQSKKLLSEELLSYETIPSDILKQLDYMLE